MTQTLLSPFDLADERGGAIGTRQLACVQTFYIARLTCHPVELVPGTFVAVTGRGAKGDSNGSGKTSFLAAVSLLLGDREWRLGGGAKAPTALLFDPRAIGGSAHGERSEAAGHGYVIGLFEDPDDPQRSARTVWCRIDTTAPYLTVRWADGVRLVPVTSDLEAHQAADATWAELPRHDFGFDTYAHRLYGDTPRCLAYVQQRGDRRNPPSLLQMHAGEFSPEEIGDSLIRLSGHRHLLDEELGHRKQLAEQQAALDDRRREDAAARLREDESLDAVRERDEARGFREHARRHWRLHFARGFLDVLAERDRLDEQLELARSTAADAAEREQTARAALRAVESEPDLEAALDAATDADEVAQAAREEAAGRVHETTAELRIATAERNQLLDTVGDATVAPVDDAERGVAHTQRERDDVYATHIRAGDDMRAARALVEAIAGGGDGTAGPALAALRAQGLAATRLIDVVQVDDDGRPFWEPALDRWRDAIVVDDEQLADALHTVRALPGTVLVTGTTNTEPLPTGIAVAPVVARRFLARLAARHQPGADPPRAIDADLGAHVVGGFDVPILGRDARLAAAREASVLAEAASADADRRLALAERGLTEARRALERSVAAAALHELRTRIEILEATLVQRRGEEDARASEADATRKALVRAEVRSEHHASQLQQAQAELDRAHDARTVCDQEIARLEYDRTKLAVDYWSSGWGSDPDAARHALVDEPRGEKRLRKEASEGLKKALWALGMRDERASTAPTQELGDVVRRRYQLLDDDDEPGTESAGFDDVDRALGEYLDSWADQDALTASTIEADRAHRAEAIGTAARAADELEHGLHHLQDATASIIESALGSVSDELDRLRRTDDGYGASLDVTSARPDGPTGLWRWTVVPKWRRAPGGPLVRYDTRANTAQEKLFTVHLVLAALLASPHPRGRVLVLDELGDSLGHEHRRAVLRAISTTAARTGITVLGTCQDSVLVDAAAECGEILYFDHPNDSEVLNRPTRMFGHDELGARVELTADLLRLGRPPV